MARKLIFKDDKKEKVRFSEYAKSVNSPTFEITVLSITEGKTKLGTEAFYLELADKILIVYKTSKIGQKLDELKDQLKDKVFILNIKKLAYASRIYYVIDKVYLDE